MSAPPTVLLVDDEPRILSALTRCLRREGYDLRTADSPEAGLRLLESEPVDLIVSDHKMPRMNGFEFLAAAADRAPDCARLLLTGWTEELAPSQLASLGVHALVPKPWGAAELKHAIRSALESRRRS